MLIWEDVEKISGGKNLRNFHFEDYKILPFEVTKLYFVPVKIWAAAL